jgi:hypothetical protein
MSDNCIWTYGGDWESDYYETSCNEMFSLIDGTPEQNNYRFCPACGKPLVSVMAEPDKDDE